MNYTKALRAAHILKKFCARRNCNNCIFRDSAKGQCELYKPPRHYQLKPIDERLYDHKENIKEEST